MHELAVTQSLLNIALEHAEQAEAKQITRLTIVMGDLSSFVNESVQFYWDIIAEGTIAQGAELAFKRIPAQFECQNCGHSYSPLRGELHCPQCGSPNVKVTGGDEFRLESIDVET
ncbi:MAG: hydrogenase maturation nickel metallochaperone HypA [Chloroflexi bacterium]|nr:hydrogenase maturation nickel metallochaperone HypA [Chloroflexota bacterium]